MILDFNKIESISKKLKSEDKKIVFTNGCFDILHAGHVTYLREAKKQGDILILGLNSDSSVKRLKGQDRPINNENDRALILEELESVDFVVVFGEDTPYNLIKAIMPDVLVKGGDYKEDDIIGADLVKEYGGQVKTIPFLEGRSTSGTIEKLKKL